MGCSPSSPGRTTSQVTSKEAAARDAHKSASKRKEALLLAEDLFHANKSKRFHESYARLTLTSYG